MKDSFEELIDKYTELKKERTEIENEVVLERAERLLNDIKKSGKFVADIEKRSTLSGIAHGLGEIIFEISNIYPSVRLEFPEFSTGEKYSTEQNSETTTQQSSLLVLLILICTMIGVGYLTKDALFSLFGQYSKDYGTFIIYIGFAGASLISAVVMFGIIKSTGIFKKSTRKGQYEFGGAMAGFSVMLVFLIATYQVTTQGTHVIEFSGNVRFVEYGKPVGPVIGANAALSKFPEYETKTDHIGNFTLKIPASQKLQEIEMQITHESKTYYHSVQTSKPVIIEIEKPKEKSHELQLSGNVRFVEDEKPVGPVVGANVALSKYSGYKTKTDHLGNFILNLPENLEFQKTEIQIVYKSKSYYHTVQHSHMKDLIIEIEKDMEQKKDLTGNWLYYYGRTDAEPELWTIAQEGNILKINVDDPLISVEGRYFFETNEFFYSYKIPVTTDGPPDVLDGNGKMDSTGNIITGTIIGGIFTEVFVLKRVPK